MNRQQEQNRWKWNTALISALAVLSFKAISAPSRAKKPAPIKVEQLKNWGIANTKAKSHLNALEAWTITEGSKDVLVAVIDTGLDSNHPDLKNNVYHDKSGNYGWNYVTNTANPLDDHGHGTHVAGIVGAVANPKTGVSGVAQKVSIMAVKYYSDSNPGSVNLKNTVKALEYAVNSGAKIINYSGGGPEFSEDEYLAIKKAEAKGILVVAAAGNEHQNTDMPENFYYPAAYKVTNLISVAATDINNNLLRSSNWGKAKVDVTAPGENIFSTLPNGRYGYMSGTSQATAFVTGIAALLLSKNPSLTPSQLRELIKKNVDPIPGLSEKVAAGGRVNALKALVAIGGVVPDSAPNNLLRAIARGPTALLDAIVHTMEKQVDQPTAATGIDLPASNDLSVEATN